MITSFEKNSVKLGKIVALSTASLHCRKNGRVMWTKEKSFWVFLKDLSKAFDCLLHDLLVFKMYAYEFNARALRLVKDYLSNYMQRIIFEKEYSSWKEIQYGIPEDSMLGAIFFKASLCDLFFIIKSTLEITPQFIRQLIISLTFFKIQKTLQRSIFKLFANNQMQGNGCKCNVLLSTNVKIVIKIDSTEIENSQSKKLLGVTTKSTKFRGIIYIWPNNNICRQAKAQLAALSRVTLFMNFNQKK